MGSMTKYMELSVSLPLVHVMKFLTFTFSRSCALSLVLSLWYDGNDKSLVFRSADEHIY